MSVRGLVTAALVLQSVAASTPAGDQPIQLATATGTIAGSLRLPASSAGKVPVVLVIAGSGATDRNGNSLGAGVRSDAYQMLAGALAERGIASVRYDKRLIGESAQPGVKESDLTFEALVGDAADWVSKLAQDPRFSTVTIVGHSEGSLIGMMAARQAHADGFVSIAGAGRAAGAILRDQLRPQLQPVPTLWDASETILSSLEAGKTVDSVPAALTALYRPSVQPYLISWLKYTPSAEIAKLTIPMLILQGTTDIQVSVSEANLLHTSAPSSRLVIVDGMNHILKHVPSDRLQQLASYSDPSLPIAPEVPAEVAALVAGLRSK
jgi:pimeloyl-ACP methyl ester carboxylesterase